MDTHAKTVGELLPILAPSPGRGGRPFLMEGVRWLPSGGQRCQVDKGQRPVPSQGQVDPGGPHRVAALQGHAGHDVVVLDVEKVQEGLGTEVGLEAPQGLRPLPYAAIVPLGGVAVLQPTLPAGDGRPMDHHGARVEEVLVEGLPVVAQLVAHDPRR